MQHNSMFVGWLYFCKILIDCMKKRKNNTSVAVMPVLQSPITQKSPYSNEVLCSADGFATVYFKIGNAFVAIQC